MPTDASNQPPPFMLYLKHRIGDAPGFVRKQLPSGMEGMGCICGVPLRVGDHIALVPLGPGSDREERASAARGDYFSAIAIALHYACATGSDVERAAG